MEGNQTTSALEPSYLESGDKNSNSSALKYYDPSWNGSHESTASDRGNSWSIYQANSGGEAWGQSEYDLFLH